MTISPKVLIFRNVPGVAGKCNDIIYKHPTLPPAVDFLVYFGGDVQDTEDNMKKHLASKKHIQWCLENTSDILSTNFPKNHILVVRPARMHKTIYSAYSCFDNFVPGSELGVPDFQPTYNALRHLKELVKSSLESIKKCGFSEDMANCKIDNIKLTLIGFSKGCVVLNQMLHEFHYYQGNFEHEINDFVKVIRSMWWLDGGHGGSKNTWITDKTLLESFVKLRIPVHIHVTPYQIEDSHRPWIRIEENTFCNTLRTMGASVQRTLHFEGKPRTLTAHFNILKAIQG